MDDEATMAPDEIGYSTGIVMYPCDRGVPNNVTARGWHHFQANEYGVACCVYCGRFPS